jgi:hypothetical protein
VVAEDFRHGSWYTHGRLRSFGGPSGDQLTASAVPMGAILSQPACPRDRSLTVFSEHVSSV